MSECKGYEYSKSKGRSACATLFRFKWAREICIQGLNHQSYGNKLGFPIMPSGINCVGFHLSVNCESEEFVYEKIIRIA